MSSDPNQPTATSPGPVIANPKDIQGILALAVVLGYIGVAAAVIFTKIVTDPSALLAGLSALATAVVGFYFGVKSQQ